MRTSTLEMYSIKLTGHVIKHKKLYIEDFYYNVDEDYDKVIKNIDKVESRTKIYRKEDFKLFYKENYQ